MRQARGVARPARLYLAERHGAPEVDTEEAVMWDTAVEISTHLTHDPPCPRCGHGDHRFLPCDHCVCTGSERRVDAGDGEPIVLR
jgi:hypothetical protein